jgi:hypothetical protein
MKTKLMLSLLTISLAIANAANMTVSSPLWINGTELKPGEYKVAVAGDKVTFSKGKTVVEATATSAGAAEKKFGSTSFVSVDSKMKELYIGGTTTKLTFDPSAAPVAAGTK